MISVVSVINISRRGPYLLEIGGEYRPTGEWSAGHPVYSNGDLYLCVRPGEGTAWSVRDSPNIELAELLSGSVTWCPTSPRAAVSHSDKQRSWQYWDGGFWQDGSIRVTRTVIAIAIIDE